MGKTIVTDLDEQIRVIDILIRRAKTREDGSDLDLVPALADIAKGLRGRREAPTGKTITQFEDRIRGTLRTRTGLGYDMNSLAEIGAYAIGAWPTVRQALEKFQED